MHLQGPQARVNWRTANPSREPFRGPVFLVVMPDAGPAPGANSRIRPVIQPICDLMSGLQKSAQVRCGDSVVAIRDADTGWPLAIQPVLFDEHSGRVLMSGSCHGPEPDTKPRCSGLIAELESLRERQGYDCVVAINDADARRVVFPYRSNAVSVCCFIVSADFRRPDPVPF